MNNYYVYTHIKADDRSPFYVGKGKSDRAQSKSGRSDYWKRIVAKHGYEIKFIDDCLPEDQAFELEMFLIQFYRENDIKLCNLTNGGEGCSGSIRSEATRQIMRDKLTGRTFSKKTLQKMSESQKGNTNARNGKGKKLSPAHIARIIEFQTGKKRPEHSKAMSGDSNPAAVRVVNLDTQEIFNTMVSACQSINRSRRGIEQSIKRNGKCAGFHWAYLDTTKKETL